MNSIIVVDLNEDILLETHISAAADELLALVCEQPFLMDVILERTLPRIKRYAEDNFGCNIDIHILCTIEGHTSVEVKLKHFAREEDASLTLSILKEDGLVSLMKDTVKTLAALLLFPTLFATTAGPDISIGSVLKTLSALQAAVKGHTYSYSKLFLSLFLT